MKNKKDKRKKKNKEPSVFSSITSDFKDGLKESTRRIVKASVYIIISLILGFSAIGKAGMLGEYIEMGVYYLAGVIFYILPIIFLLLAIASIVSVEEKLSILRKIALSIFTLSILGLSESIWQGTGGLIGNLIMQGLGYLFDLYLSVFILVILSVISIFIIFDFEISIDTLRGLKNIWPFKKKEGNLFEEDSFTNGENEEERDAEEREEEEMEEEDEEKATPVANINMGDKKEEKTEVSGIEISPISADDYTPPPLSLLSNKKDKPSVGDIKANANLIKRTLQNFGIDTEIDEVSIGPSVTRYAIKPAEGVRLSKIVSLQSNLELALAAHPVRIEAPIPGRSLVGIEIPNSARATVTLSSLLGSNEFQNSKNPLTIGLGKSISGQLHFGHIAKMPHLLIAGATGAGKSVTIHSLIASLLFKNSPQNLRLIMVDPKHVELTLYKNIPHLLTPVITDPKKTILALKWAAKEMERRYDILEAEAVRDIQSYHKNVLAPAQEKAEKNGNMDDSKMPEAMPYIVIIIDEIADIMHTYPRELESAVVRLAQMSRAVGIHLILSTQRPSVNVITGLIKANIPARVALQVSSQIDSRTILDTGGAERLLGAGDMLYLSGEMGKPIRIQSAFVSENEIKKISKYLARQFEDELPNEIQFNENGNGDSGGAENIFDAMEQEEEEDGMYEEAKSIVIKSGKASTSYLQRRLRIGYSRAARLMDILEDRGIVSAANGAKPREILVSEEEAGGENYNESENETASYEDTKTELKKEFKEDPQPKYNYDNEDDKE